MKNRIYFLILFLSFTIFAQHKTLEINNHKAALDSLQSIKNQPKILGTVKTVVLISGLVIVGASIIAASGGNDAAFLLFTVGAGTTISAGIIEGKWTFKIVEK
jgi:type IV secretory pathway VirB2 component (pilin)